jgi:2-succinyl-5-enolpyruvyl-6-hydroxy-3-cyclohexene-1-carboxylate synthase
MTSPLDIHVLLRAFADELARSGIAGVCTSPGSRSTPLLMALRRQPGLTLTSHVDERSAGFFALGLAKATGRPAVLVCTSGTAAANYLPAVVEAREARVPLVVLTADRPPELRDTGAGQAIDQLGLYGAQARWFVEVGVENATPETCRWIRTLACRAVATATDGGGGRAGAVHLNWPLREPLVPDEPLPAEEPGGGGRADGRPWVVRLPVRPDPAQAGAMLAPVVAASSRGLIVVGRDERGVPHAEGPSALARAVDAFAQASGWPVLADPLSGARHGSRAIAHYDALLRVPAFAAAARPDTVLRIGDLPPSGPLRRWLGALDAVQVLVDPEGAWPDPAQVADLNIAADPASTLTDLAGRVTGVDPAWTAAWSDADHRAATAIDATLGDGLSDPSVARALGTMLPDDATLFVAASMPIRDVETFAPVRAAPLRVLSNRGANGIDGTIATAFGVAAVTDGPVVLLLGDVAFAHDIGSLLIARRIGIPMTIVLVDNGGGAIFDFLAIATQEDVFEQHVATPTGLDPAAAAELFGLHLLAPATAGELCAAVDHGISSAGTTLVHVRTDRSENIRLHREIWEAVGAGLAEPPA